MPRKDEIERLLSTYNRRLQKLKEQKAMKGISTNPETLLEIEDIEAEIAQLQTELAQLQNEQRPNQQVDLPPDTPPGGTKGRIILIEDETNWSDEISYNLRNAEYEVFTCHSYERAVERLTHHKFDLSILDLNLKGKDDFYGLWLLEDIILAHQIPAIIVSGYVFPQMVGPAIRELGVFAVLDKGNMLMSDLVETVHHAKDILTRRQYIVSETRLGSWQQQLHELYAKMKRRQLGGNELTEAMRSTLIQHRRRLTQLLTEEEILGVSFPEVKQEEMKGLQARITELEKELLQLDLPYPEKQVESRAAIMTHQQQLRQRLSRLTDEDLRNLCFDLNVDYDDLRGEGKNGKARELILFFVRQHHLAELVAVVDQTEQAKYNQ